MAEPRTEAVTAEVRARSTVGLAVVAGLLVVAVVAQPLLRRLFDDPAVANWSTIFVSIAVQATPFLVLGVAVSGAIAAFVPADAVARRLPRRAAFAVPVAAGAGMALPGCECGSVPVAKRLMTSGVTPAAAVTFLLAAPAVNPVVLVSTAVAFQGRPVMVLARLAASLLAAVVVGWLWTVVGRGTLPPFARRPAPVAGSRLGVFLATARHDFLSAGGFLMIGAAAAATLQTVVPRAVVDAFAGSPWGAVLALAVLAVLLSICSEADAFVAASMRQFSPTAQLAFMVVGPMVDLKLAALQAGTFGRAFAVRLVPLTFACAVGSAALVGWIVL